jgi:hypothetical protein
MEYMHMKTTRLAFLFLVAAIVLSAQGGAAVTPVSAGQIYRVRLPLVVKPTTQQTGGCPTTSSRSYSSGIMYQFDNDNPVRPAWNHADKNIDLRGYNSHTASSNFIDYGSGDPFQPPQFATLFSPHRVPNRSAYRANSWNWANSPNPGSAGGPITDWAVTVLGLQTTAGEELHAPTHGRNIGQDFGMGGSMVIYADADTITLKFTREDSAAPGTGYTMHIDNICTDPNLLALYNSLDGTARNTHSSNRPYGYQLPGLTVGKVFGTARGNQIRVAIVDSGAFMDPRSCNEWWQVRPGHGCQ